MERLFLMLKSGPGFMVSHMDSLIKGVANKVDIDLTYGIAIKLISRD